MFISPAFAQTTAAAGSGRLAVLASSSSRRWSLFSSSSTFCSSARSRPSRSKLKARLSAIKRGDKVVTAGGIVGLVKKAADGSE